ncbi:MAG: hypothetical protein U5M53_03265 [Rhodoferax sp.]|nr:hypothetical protein [Rhodoferax sp.]
MAKVKMSDVKSGSKNVKSLFRTPMINRTDDFLRKYTFTNDELLEILDISQNIEKETLCSEFL